MTSLTVDKKLPSELGKILYVSHLARGRFDRRWGLSSTSSSCSSNSSSSSSSSFYIEDTAKAASDAAIAANGAVAVAVAAVAAAAAQTAASQAVSKRAQAASEEAALYTTTKAFLEENPEFHYVWMASACLPPRQREGKRSRGSGAVGGGELGTVPGVFGAEMLEKVHPSAMLASDAMLVVAPEREQIKWSPDRRKRYTDLDVYR